MLKTLCFLYCTIIVTASSLSGQPVLTLEKAVETALVSNFQVQIARNNALIDKTNNTLGNAGFLPEVALNFGQNFNINNTKQEFFSGDIRQGNNVNTNTLNTNIQLGWTVFDGFRMFVNQDRLREIEAIGQLTVRQQMETTISQVMALYFAIEQQQERINAIEEAIAFSNERIVLSSSRFAAGATSSLPVLQARVDMNADSALLVQQQLQLATLKIQLNQTMGITPETPFQYSASQDDTLVDYSALLATALEKNSMLQLNDKQLRLAELAISTWESNKYPTIDINAGYNFNRLQAEIGILRFNQNAGMSFGLTGRWNLFNGWNNKREIQVARLNKENATLTKDRTSLDLKSALLTLYQEFLTAQSQMEMEQRNIDIAEENLSISAEKLRVGTITPIELRQAQINLIDARFRKTQARFSMKNAVLSLKQLSGQLIKT